MTPRSLFAIFIKIIGIYLIVNAATIIPQWIVTIYEFGYQSSKGNSQGFLSVAFFLFLMIVIYSLIIRYCFFKTDWIIEKLHLANGFSEDKLEINIHRSTVLKIAVIVTGAVILIDYLPGLCQHTFAYFQMGGADHGFKENPNSKYLIYDLVKIFIGYFLVTSSRLVVNFIERKRKGSAVTEQMTD